MDDDALASRETPADWSVTRTALHGTTQHTTPDDMPRRSLSRGGSSSSSPARSMIKRKDGVYLPDGAAPPVLGSH